jgi:hypothetical protein
LTGHLTSASRGKICWEFLGIRFMSWQCSIKRYKAQIVRKKIRGKVEGFIWPWTYSSKSVCPKIFHLELQVYS